jgi:hypothetical protein
MTPNLCERLIELSHRLSGDEDSNLVFEAAEIIGRLPVDASGYPIVLEKEYIYDAAKGGLTTGIWSIAFRLKAYQTKPYDGLGPYGWIRPEDCESAEAAKNGGSDV